MKMKQKLPLIMSLLGSFALAACGGGGGGSSSTTQAAAPAASAPSAPSPASTPTVTGEALPSLASPQAGSTAATGNGFEGIWTDTTSSRVTAMIDPANNISYLSGLFSFVTSTFFGAATTAAPNWTLTSGFEVMSNLRYTATAGSGTYAANQTLTGSYVANGSTVNLSLKYDPANALAVSQSSVTGTWAQNSTTLTVDDAGGVTGNILGCAVSGTLTLTTPGSSKNLYTLTMTGTTSTCTLASGVTYTGNAAITFLPVTGSTTLYQRSIIYLIKATDNSVIAYGQLTKH
ncbi:hypothetical protein [Paraburkholderia phenoliruptrix]|uniref:Lipoprotein n=2 Tax=Paraburkholderia phenoliruptrix TaxID=252970 RepID=A0A6J5K146_9BURK|nr:hypothetical protein [Paraburkholderia phenoliruptrix]CAB3724712.1 hypothetical protein LMG22037_05062 [Paraburkholderia phenoliruptrix]CAB4047457.1 hypothetical protein LMG9964_01089 [Paraburkholderia phenoliruptrix]